jgi:glycosyltransferase involved in cell wall biosynthesis
MRRRHQQSKRRQQYLIQPPPAAREQCRQQPENHDQRQFAIGCAKVHWAIDCFANFSYDDLLVGTHTVTQRQELRLAVLMPVRDDWASASELIRRLDEAVSSYASDIDIVLVDDGSLQRYDRDNFQSPFSAVRAIRILRLRRNLGHQRAIAIGLAYIQKTISCDAVLVMDSDGEDTPEGVTDLLNAYSSTYGTKAIFAERSRRSESLVFRFFYHLYRVLHRALTGISVRVGNFSILPSEYLNTLVAMSELWNHYAAAVFRSKLPFTMIPIPRGTRIAGNSRMDFAALVSHGLSAISVFGDVVGVRLLVGSLSGSFLAGLGIVLVVIIRLFTNRAIPGWATSTTATLAIIMIQCITIAASFTFFLLSNRTNLGFIPFRDFSLFLEEAVDVYSHE